MGRLLRSKRLRAVLWYAADGKCQCCGINLPPNWHADHIIPYSKTQTTNVHDMQALCPQCNLRKGSKMTSFKLRKHQTQLVDAVKRLKAGEDIYGILACITPGGGKSLIPTLLSPLFSSPDRYGAASIFSSNTRTVSGKVCVITPRSNLREQMEQDSVSELHQHFAADGYRLKASANVPDPARGSTGYVTTYASVTAAPDLHRLEFDRHSYTLILDECHHVSDDNASHKAISSLFKKAKLRVLMTGTPYRNGNEKIALAPYTQEGSRYSIPSEGLHVIDGKKWFVVHYTRIDALTDRAIIPIEFVNSDAYTRYSDREGNEVEFSSFDEAGEDCRAAIHTAISTEFAYTLINDCLDSWQRHRRHNKRAKALIVVHQQSRAKEVAMHLQERGYRVGLAISDAVNKEDFPLESVNDIRRFKLPYNNPEADDILVSVAKAYEGLDVPSATHLCLLTHVRSAPWLEQVLNRVTRFDRDGLPYEQQRAFVFAPDDPLFRSVKSKILADQADLGIEQQGDEDGKGLAPPGGFEDVEPTEKGIIPFQSHRTTEYISSPDLGFELTPKLTALYKQFIDARNLSITPSQMEEMIEYLKPSMTEEERQQIAAARSDHSKDFDGKIPMLTASQEETRVRAELVRRINQVNMHYSKHFNRRLGWVWDAISGEFAKHPKDMTIHEMMLCQRFLNENYPTTRQVG